MTTPLPSRPRIRDHEDIAAFLHRCADANGLKFTELAGLNRRAQAWEKPTDAKLLELSRRTQTPAERLRRATVSSAYPTALLARAMLGRRHGGQPATCPSCSVVTTAARLYLFVLCPRCHTLLADPFDPDPLPAPPTLVRVQSEVLHASSISRRSKRAKDRLTRLEALMKAQEKALYTNWPALFPGETLEWRDRVNRLCNRVVHGEFLLGRPPSVTATLMALSWPVSEDPTATTARLDTLAYKCDSWAPPMTNAPLQLRYEEAAEQLRIHVRRKGIRFQHVPTTIRFANESLVLPPYLQPTRTAEAIATAAVVHSLAEGGPIPDARRVAEWQGHNVANRVIRLANWMTTERYMHLHFAAHAARLHDEGHTDIHRLRGELRNVAILPRSAIRNLPRKCRDTPQVMEIAAAWVWLDATQGRLAGGPHPQMSAYTLHDFNEALNPEGRLVLRRWWQERTSEITDGIQAQKVRERGHLAG